MGGKERLAVGTLLTMVALFAPGFLLHEAPRFPGSLVGGLLGVASSAAMVLLLAYSLAKHVLLRRRSSWPALLSFHVYAGAVGAVLGILHTGHKYQSPLGIALVVAMLTVVLSGFVGRYYLARIGADIREQQRELGALRTRYDLIAANPAAATAPPGVPVPALVAGIADLEDAIGRREALKWAASRWVVVHIVAALVFYPLLTLHVWSGVYYGLRWLP